MSELINEALWQTTLSERDWYLKLAPDFKRLESLAAKDPNNQSYHDAKEAAYQLVEAALNEKAVPLANSGVNLDEQRQVIDTIVIHHTKNKSGMSLSRLNAMHLLRLYGLHYADTPKLRGQAVWSNHFYNEEQVFWAYHWLVREDGSAHRLLDDKYIGWHSGNWVVNTSSVAICIDDDLTNKAPGSEVIQAIIKIIIDNYAKVHPASIIGHSEVNKNTACPGDPFIMSWKQKVIPVDSI